MGSAKKEQSAQNKEKKSDKQKSYDLNDLYRKFDNIDTDSDSDEKQPQRPKQQQKKLGDVIPSVSKEDELEYLKHNGITQYSRGKSGMNIGLGDILTEKEFQAMRQKDQNMHVINK